MSKTTIIQKLTIDLRALKKYVEGLKSLTDEELQEEVDAYTADYKKAVKAAAKETNWILRMPPYWMMARAEAAAAELTKRTA